MSDEFVSEIRMFAGSYVPHNWAQCNGQSLGIAQNSTLYSLIGNYYGGDQTNFNLPNLQGRAPMSQGQGTGLSPRHIGETGGETTVSLDPDQTPSHTHAFMAGLRGARTANSPDPTKVLTAILPPDTSKVYASGTHTPAPMNSFALQNSGDGSAHNNVQPYLGILFGISLYGIYPMRP